MKIMCVLIGACALMGAGCRSVKRRASKAECQVIFNRIVALELREAGYADPALEKLKQKELSLQFQEDLQSCVGRRLRHDAVQCARAAESTEALSHTCLR